MMAGIPDPAAADPIILEIRPAAVTYWGVVDLSGGTRVHATIQRAPWRSLGLGIIGATVAVALRSETVLHVDLLLTLLLGVVEAWHRKDFLTSTHLVRQYGFLGRVRRRLPLPEVTEVEVRHPRFGRAFNVGDVVVSSETGGMTFVGVASPRRLAEAILSARDRLRSRRTTRW